MNVISLLFMCSIFVFVVSGEFVGSIAFITCHAYLNLENDFAKGQYESKGIVIELDWRGRVFQSIIQ